MFVSIQMNSLLKALLAFWPVRPSLVTCTSLILQLHPETSQYRAGTPSEAEIMRWNEKLSAHLMFAWGWLWQSPHTLRIHKFTAEIKTFRVWYDCMGGIFLYLMLRFKVWGLAALSDTHDNTSAEAPSCILIFILAPCVCTSFFSSFTLRGLRHKQCQL